MEPDRSSTDADKLRDRMREGDSSRVRDTDREKYRHSDGDNRRPRSDREIPSRREVRDRSSSRQRDRDSDKHRSSRRRRERDNHPRSRSRSPHRHYKDKDDRHSHRSRHHKSRPSQQRGRSRSESSSGDSSSSESSGESDSEDERRRRKRKEKAKKREKEDKEERRRRKERKRAKRDKKKRSTAASTAQWGQYGLISEQDFTKKDSEFRAWLVEERKINPETVSKDRTKKEFAIFVEDYNTATLPHDKYYDMARFELKMNMIRSGQTLPDEVGGYDPAADMKAHSSSMKSTAKEKETFLSKEQVAELRRIEAERTEIGKRRLMGMDVPRNMGVRTEEQ
ncbi:hypothetical protein IAR55_004365 [Kwoniella newhampshirensis]|uniref:Splicing factor, arginine/serine-rich 16 n=1 Tax=Kwoniella newhampshirensis TaxID=1651941 RepID=A0AAW0YXK5_9TREE